MFYAKSDIETVPCPDQRRQGTDPLSFFVSVYVTGNANRDIANARRTGYNRYMEASEKTKKEQTLCSI